MSPKQQPYRIPIVDLLNGIVRKIAETTAWLNVVLIVAILASILWRYGFHNALVFLEELIWHIYAVAFMFGIAYGITIDSHVRVDLIHMNLSPKKQHIIEIIGILFLMLPCMWIVFDHSLSWVSDSYRVDEHSSAPTGLPHRWIIKSFLPMSFALMIIATVSRLIQETLLLLHHGKEPVVTDPVDVGMLKHLFNVRINELYRAADDSPQPSTRDNGSREEQS